MQKKNSTHGEEHHGKQKDIPCKSQLKENSGKYPYNK